MSLPSALAAWSQIVGAEHVITGGGALELANQATFRVASEAVAVLEPATREEVAACVLVASQFGAPIYPVSTGRNDGYGSSVPVRPGCVILSLRRLNRILALDSKLATVTLEPGVTFIHLAEYLRRHAPHLCHPQTGGPPEGSIIGTALERGVGKGPYQNLASRTLAYEVVLANGQTVHSGFGALQGARMATIAPGPGPALEGIFQQSGFGVVTSLTLRLEPMPGLMQLGTARIEGHESLAPVIDSLRPVVQRSACGLAVEIVNDYRLIAQLHRFPFGQMDPDAVLQRFWGRPSWTCGVFIAAQSENELAWRRESVPYPGFVWEAPTRSIDPPGYEGLATAYWRKRTAPPATPRPHHDRCGVTWFSPLVPMLGEEVCSAVRLIEETMLSRGFEPAISLRCEDGRAIRMIAGLLFDRDQPGADERALACHDALWDNLAATGIYPCRFTIRDMNRAPWSEPSRALHHALKGALDPAGILAPGRYE